MSEFVEFPKIARLSRPCLITEKIDGTNAQIFIGEDGTVLAGSRTRWVTPEDDNYGFAAWVAERAEVIRTALGPGRHFGEWWGQGIGRGYGLTERRFSLFNANRWEGKALPAGVSVVPVLYRGEFSTEAADYCLKQLIAGGSRAAPGFMRPEGIVVYHIAGGVGFKKTLGGDGAKGARSDG